MAERVGFEPTLPFRVNTLSKRAPSATRPSLPFSTFRMPSNYCTHACEESLALTTLAQRIAADGIATAVWFLWALDKTHVEIETLVFARLNLQGTSDKQLPAKSSTSVLRTEPKRVNALRPRQFDL